MRYYSGARTIELLSEVEGGYLVRVVEDSDPNQVGREFVLPIVQLLACYNPVPPEPPITD